VTLREAVEFPLGPLLGGTKLTVCLNLYPFADLPLIVHLSEEEQRKIVRAHREFEEVGMVASANETESPAKSARAPQVSLGGLIVIVLAAGVAAGVARSAREVWGLRTIVYAPGIGGVTGTTSQVPVERTAGLILEMISVFLLVIVARALTGLLRSARPAEREARRIHSWGIAWRVGAACFLLWFISEESRVLRVDLAREAAQAQSVPGWSNGYRAGQALFPVCGIFAILGLVVGMGARFLFPAAARAGKRPYWLFVILAGVAAVLIVALPYWASLIPYLVLIALEAVTLAMHHRLIPGPGFSARLIRAGIDASGAAAVCLALAVALAGDFERLRRGKPWVTSGLARGLRLFSLAGAAAAGLYIATVTIPGIHPWFAEGFLLILDPVKAGMIVCCFALFGAGMAARAIAGPPGGQLSSSVARLSVLARTAIVGILLFAVFNSLPDSAVLEPHVPGFVTWAVASIRGVLNYFWDRLPDSITTGALGMLAIEKFMWTSLILAIVCFVIELLLRGKPDLTSPFDRLAESPAAATQFIWLVTGFVVLCLAAVPTLIVLGQAVLHVRMHAEQLMTPGWPR
jgi:hypothetical protein